MIYPTLRLFGWRCTFPKLFLYKLIDSLPQKAQVERVLFLDMEYLLKLFQPVAPWGTQRPHE